MGSSHVAALLSLGLPTLRIPSDFHLSPGAGCQDRQPLAPWGCTTSFVLLEGQTEGIQAFRCAFLTRPPTALPHHCRDFQHRFCLLPANWVIRHGAGPWLRSASRFGASTLCGLQVDREGRRVFAARISPGHWKRGSSPFAASREKRCHVARCGQTRRPQAPPGTAAARGAPRSMATRSAALALSTEHGKTDHNLALRGSSGSGPSSREMRRSVSAGFPGAAAGPECAAGGVPHLRASPESPGNHRGAAAARAPDLRPTRVSSRRLLWLRCSGLQGRFGLG
ncbi:hypothetical protein AAY473_035649 [Plecturocebus cupreus]